MSRISKYFNSQFLQELVWMLAAFGHGAILVNHAHDLGPFEFFQLTFAIGFSLFWFHVSSLLNSKRFTQAYVGLATVGVHPVGILAIFSFIALLILFLGITVSHLDWNVAMPQLKAQAFSTETLFHNHILEIKFSSLFIGFSQSNRGPPLSL